jgi:hypothetical protein
MLCGKRVKGDPCGAAMSLWVIIDGSRAVNFCSSKKLKEIFAVKLLRAPG